MASSRSWGEPSQHPVPHERPPDIHALDGQAGIPMAYGEQGLAILPLVRVEQAFQRGCGRTEAGVRVVQAGEHDKAMSRAWYRGAGSCFVGRVVLFVHDRQAEVPEGRKSAERAPTTMGVLPGRSACAARARCVRVARGGMVHRHSVPELPLQAGDRLGGERDLRQQVKHLFTPVRAPRASGACTPSCRKR